jgi:hypothetical protein
MEHTVCGQNKISLMLNKVVNIVAYLFNERIVEAEKQPLLARTYTAEERVTYAVTSRNNRRGVASGAFCGSAPRSLPRNCLVNISLQQ